jgi:hypothetical protein
MVQKNKDTECPKRYRAIVKVGNNPDGTAYCVKYRFDDLLKFTAFLDAQWSSWRWFNLYANRGRDKGKQIANFTKYNRPPSRYV